MRSLVRWFAYTLVPGRCPECEGLLTPRVAASARQLGCHLRPEDPRREVAVDWLCCEDCTYAVCFDFFVA